ncbi:MAG: hypothetical protein Q4F95_02270 [Oscillospiraceae bacterium]|nr:hypothetical protein [Oscillospiraceae bacterium]
MDKTIQAYEEVIAKLKEWVNENYDPEDAGRNGDCLDGLGSDDCYEIGCCKGSSRSAYDIGQILDMDLEDIIYEDEEDD